jgi:hypothetical protein
MTEDAHTPFGRENHGYTLSDFRIRVWWSGVLVLQFLFCPNHQKFISVVIGDRISYGSLEEISHMRKFSSIHSPVRVHMTILKYNHKMETRGFSEANIVSKAGIVACCDSYTEQYLTAFVSQKSKTICPFVTIALSTYADQQCDAHRIEWRGRTKGVYTGTRAYRTADTRRGNYFRKLSSIYSRSRSIITSRSTSWATPRAQTQYMRVTTHTCVLFLFASDKSCYLLPSCQCLLTLHALAKRGNSCAGLLAYTCTPLRPGVFANFMVFS